MFPNKGVCRGGSTIFLGGGALVSCSTSTPINHIVFFFLQNTSCIKKPQFILWRGGAYPLHPPPRSGPGTGTFVFGRGGDLFARRNYKKLHSARVTDFCNRNTRALVFYEKGKTFTILTLNETVLILEVVILKSCILYNHY